MLEEKIIRSEAIYKGRVVNLHVHDVELPDGTQGKRELINHPGAVVIVALDDDEHVLLIRQFRLGAKQVMIELPAGTLEPGENVDTIAAAVREMREETGYRPQQIERVGGWYVAPGYTTEYLHLFIARDLVPDAIEGDEDEFIELFRVPFKEAVAMVHREEITNTTAICGLLRAAHYLGV